mmetsp:Transcript_118782/g.331383  ORF Transcript_118782/g.331383 Transcript_118782/m.331383 type:complete len:447 (-) Transcript_118782:1228-2568(-)
MRHARGWLHPGSLRHARVALRAGDAVLRLLRRRLVRDADVGGLEREARALLEQLAHLVRRGVVDAVAEDGRGRVVLQQAKVAHGRLEPSGVGQDLRVLCHLRIEERIWLVELRGLLQHSHLLHEVLQSEFLRALRAKLGACPDADRLREVPGADVADQCRPRVEHVVVEALRELLAERLVLVARVGRNDGERLLPVCKVRRANQLLEVVCHDVAHGCEEGVSLQAQELVASAGPERGAATGSKKKGLGHAAALEAALHGRRQVAHKDGLLDDGLWACRPVCGRLRSPAAGASAGRAEGLLRQLLLLPLHLLLLLLLGAGGQLVKEALDLRQVQLGKGRRRLGGARALLVGLLLRGRAHEGGARLLAKEALSLLHNSVLVETQEDGHSLAAGVLELRAHEFPHKRLVGVLLAPICLLVAVLAEPLLLNPGLKQIGAGHDFRFVGHDE